MKPTAIETLAEYKLKPEQYLELWKWFTDDAAKMKDRMWTLATFFYTALGALLSFVANDIGNESSKCLTFQKPFMIFIVALLGCFASGYGVYMIKQYGEHVRRGWNRANYIRSNIKGFDEIWYNDDQIIIEEDEERGKSMPKIIKHASIPMQVFLFIYIVLCILVIIQLLPIKNI